MSRGKGLGLIVQAGVDQAAGGEGCAGEAECVRVRELWVQDTGGYLYG